LLITLPHSIVGTTPAFVSAHPLETDMSSGTARPDATASRTGTGVLNRRAFIQTGSLLALNAATDPTSATAADRKTAPIIDTHMHVWGNNEQRYPFPHPYMADFSLRDVPHPATVEMLISDMNQNACTHAVLVQVIYHGWDNSYIADCVRRYPDRFKAHGLIDPTDPKVADKLEFEVREHGLHGMRFSPIYYQGNNHGGDDWLDAPETHRLWRMAEKLNSVFNFFIAPRQLPKLARMVKAHPDVKITIDHLSQIDLGRDPEPQMALLLSMARFPNVYVKVSELTSVSRSGQYPFQDAYPYVRRVYEAFGPHRLLFGTGYPGSARAAYKRPTLAREIELVNRFPFFSKSDREMMLGLNASKLWGFG